MTTPFQQEIQAKLREGIKPSEIKKSEPFMVPAGLNNLNNSERKNKPFAREKPSPSPRNDNYWIVENWKVFLLLGSVALVGYLLIE